MARPRLGPNLQPWKGSDANERAYNTVHNGLANIIIDGPNERSPAILEKANRVLADLNSQKPPARAQISHDVRVNQLRRMIHAAEEVVSGHRAPTGTGSGRGPALRETGGTWGIWDATRNKWLPDALRGAVDTSPARYRSQEEAERAAREWRSLNPGDRFEVRPHSATEARYPKLSPPPARFVSRARETGHRLADFNTLDDLLAHARQEGATHYLQIDDETHIYFQRRDGSYEKAEAWQKDGYWHTQAPGSRAVVRKPPPGATPIGGRSKTVESPRRSAHHRPGRSRTKK